MKFNWSGCDDKRVDLLGQEMNWSFSIQSRDSVDFQCSELEGKILSITESCVPTCILKTTKDGVPLKKAPWDCTKLRRARRNKDQAWYTFDTSPTHVNLMCAMDAQRRYESVEWNCKESYEAKLAKGIKHNTRKFFAYLRCKKKSNPSVSRVMKPNGDLTTSPKETAEVLVNSFASVFTQEFPLTEDCVLDSVISQQIVSLEIFDVDVKRELLSLNISKSAGPDGIHPRILRTLACNDNFVNAVASLFRSVVAAGRLPEVWKQAIVVAIHKKGPFRDANNYRPISLTCVLCKVFEKLLCKHLYNHVKKYISQSQHGFMVGKSCLSNLLESLECIINILESGDPVDIIYLDFQKAFDKVPHDRLLLKLRAYGISGQFYDLIRSFLSNRNMAVKVGDHLSSWVPVTSGVPQGSVLGPLLFLLFINDMPNATKFKTLLFADDSKIIGNANFPNTVQSDINSLIQWADTWQMSFNTTKCSVVHIGKGNPVNNYMMNNIDLNNSDSEKDLGVTLSSGESPWENHINDGIGKAKRNIAWLIRNVLSRKAEILVPLYKAFVRPHLEYCVQVWSPVARHGNWGTIMSIESCQRDFTRVISGMGLLTYEERLEKLGLTTLLERRMRGDLIETYKIRTNQVNYGSNMFNINSYYNTRNLNDSARYKTQLGSDFFSRRVLKYWNNLP